MAERLGRVGLWVFGAATGGRTGAEELARRAEEIGAGGLWVGGVILTPMRSNSAPQCWQRRIGCPERVLAALGRKILELARDRTSGGHPYL